MVVPPFKFFEVVTRVSLPDAMVGAHTFPDPCPYLVRTLFYPFIFCKPVKFSAANETRITLPAAGSFLFGAIRMEVKNCFIILKRINVDLTAVFQLYAEYRWLLAPSAYFALAPFAPGFLVLHMYVSCVHGEIKTETQQDLGALQQLVIIRYFMDAELLAAYGAFFASISQSVQSRPFPTIRAK